MTRETKIRNELSFYRNVLMHCKKLDSQIHYHEIIEDLEDELRFMIQDQIDEEDL